MNFNMPPKTKNNKGELRRVGFEIEYAGVDLTTTAQIVRTIFGGQHVVKSQFEHEVTGTAYGDFSLEVDSSYLKNKDYETYLAKIGIDVESRALGRDLEDGLARLASGLVPNEVVTPPLPLDQLTKMDELREALRLRDAAGTRSSIVTGFGLHLNPELPDFDADTIVRYVRAFMLLYSWISRESRIDLTRRLLPYINEFPNAYVRLVTNPDYRPTMDELISDYLEWNPTRNRPLDLLPLLATIDEDKVRGASEEPNLIKPRPTFHYRLPNCEIDDPDWRIAREWNYWVEVERLAGDEQRMIAMSREFLEIFGSVTNIFQRKWVERVPRWLAS